MDDVHVKEPIKKTGRLEGCGIQEQSKTTQAKSVARRQSAGQGRDGRNGTLGNGTDLASLARDRPQSKEGATTNLPCAHQGQSCLRACERTPMWCAGRAVGRGTLGNVRMPVTRRRIRERMKLAQSGPRSLSDA